MADEKQYISRVKLSDQTYDIKDEEARALLDYIFGTTLILDCGTADSDTSVTTE